MTSEGKNRKQTKKKLSDLKRTRVHLHTGDEGQHGVQVLLHGRVVAVLVRPDLNTHGVLVHRTALVAHTHNIARRLPVARLLADGLAEHDGEHVGERLAALRLCLAENREAPPTGEALELGLDFVAGEDKVVIVREQRDGGQGVDGAVDLFDAGHVAELLGLVLVVLAFAGGNVEDEPLVLEEVQRLLTTVALATAIGHG